MHAESTADVSANDGPEQLNQLLYARDELMNRYGTATMLLWTLLQSLPDQRQNF